MAVRDHFDMSIPLDGPAPWGWLVDVNDNPDEGPLGLVLVGPVFRCNTCRDLTDCPSIHTEEHDAHPADSET